MKIAGFFLMLAGWLLVLAALIMLRAGVSRNAFILAGLGVQTTGLTIVVRAHGRVGNAAGSRR
jgi:hypothetical protein